MSARARLNWNPLTTHLQVSHGSPIGDEILPHRRILAQRADRVDDQENGEGDLNKPTLRTPSEELPALQENQRVQSAIPPSTSKQSSEGLRNVKLNIRGSGSGIHLRSRSRVAVEGKRGRKEVGEEENRDERPMQELQKTSLRPCIGENRALDGSSVLLSTFPFNSPGTSSPLQVLRARLGVRAPIRDAAQTRTLENSTTNRPPRRCSRCCCSVHASCESVEKGAQQLERGRQRLRVKSRVDLDELRARAAVRRSPRRRTK